MKTKVELARGAFSPGEFAVLFGKLQTWGYRQIYAGKVRAITEHGRILIPAAEVESILKTAGVYDGLKPKATKKAQIQDLAPKLQNAWQNFLIARRQATSPKSKAAAVTMRPNWPLAVSGRQKALARLKGTGKDRYSRSQGD